MNKSAKKEFARNLENFKINKWRFTKGLTINLELGC